VTELVARVRLLWRHATHTLAVVLSLSIGMAICVAVFAVVDAVVLAAVPGIDQRHTVVRVTWGDCPTLFTPAEFHALDRWRGGGFSSVAAQGNDAVVVVAPSGPLSTTAAFVSDRFFETLGTRALRGRLLVSDDMAGARAPAVVISESFWRGPLNGSADVVGSALTIGDRAYTVVGVAPARMPGLTLLDLGSADAAYPQLWLGLREAVKGSAERHQQTPWLSVAGRLQPGSDVDAIRAELAVVQPRLASGARHRRTFLQAWTAGLDWRSRPYDAVATLGLFMFLPLGILAIGCVNVVNLQLARAVDQAGELSLRVALGASRWMLLAILSVDGMLLSIASGILGWIGGTAVVAAVSPFVDVPVAVNTRVALLVVGLIGAAGAVTGLLPAWLSTRATVADGLRLLHHSGGPLRTRARRVLVALQLAGSLPLLALSGLAAQALQQQRFVLPPHADRVLLAEFALADVRVTPPTPGPFIDAVLDRLRREPAVEAAAFATFGAWGGRVRYWRVDDDAAVHRYAAGGHVTRGWFEATGAHFLAGRPPGRGPAASDTEVAINAALASALGHEGSRALGRGIRLPAATGAAVPGPVTMTVVGVIADTETSTDGRAVPVVVLPMPPEGFPTLVLTAKTHDAARGRQALARAVAAADPAVPVSRVESVEGRTGERRRGAVGLVALGLVFGGLALTLAAVGLYSLLAYTVRRRSREVGIRMTLGAERRDILWLIVSQAMPLVLAGSMCGLAFAVPMAGLMRSVLVGIQPFEPWALLPAIGALVLVALIASAGPAYRAASVDPARTLRQE
jgi:predicted permease